jgi:hypothetical protein
MYIECDIFHFYGMHLNGIYGNKINKIKNLPRFYHQLEGYLGRCKKTHRRQSEGDTLA